MSTVKRSRADALFVAVNFVILALVAIVVAYPIIYVLSASFSDPIAITEALSTDCRCLSISNGRL